MQFGEALPRLLTAYDAGRLTPFVGAGMSRPTCPSWAGLLEGLEERAGIRPSDMSAINGADLIKRAYRAVALLKRRSCEHFLDAIGAVLYSERNDVPRQTKTLARTWWPLIISTNYDDLVFRAVRENAGGKGGMLVLGRSSRDCNRLLASLQTPSPPVLWALQGFFPSRDSAFTPLERAEVLKKELVVGHEEYRQVTHRIPWFRRAFAEIFRSRSLIFLGAGLADPYLLELFGEVLEMMGSCPSVHFALVEEGKTDPQFLLSRYNIIALEYPAGNHERVIEWMEELNVSLDAERPKQISWTYSFRLPKKLPTSDGSGDLSIVRGPFPDLQDNECVGVSAGRDQNVPLVGLNPHRFFPHKPGKMGYRWLKCHSLAVCTVDGQDESVFYIVARERDETNDSDVRHIRTVRLACLDFLDEASRRGFHRARVQLLAVGAKKVFPATFALIQQIRAIKEWFQTHPTSVDGNRLSVILHVVDPNAWFNVLSGRVNLQELLQCEDIRITVEIASDGTDELRDIRYLPAQKSLLELSVEYGVSAPDWSVEIIPSPSVGRTILELKPIDHDEVTLESIGVIPGSTVRFFRSRQNDVQLEA